VEFGAGKVTGALPKERPRLCPWDWFSGDELSAVEVTVVRMGTEVSIAEEERVIATVPLLFRQAV
jgi:hypothetical protein